MRQAQRLLAWLLALGGLGTIVVAAVFGDYRNEALVLTSVAAFTLALAGFTHILKAAIGDPEAAAAQAGAQDMATRRGR